MLITEIEACGRGKVRIRFEDRSCWTVSKAAADALGWQPDTDLSEEAYRAAYESFVAAPAVEKALTLLERRDYTQKDLTQKLIASGFPEEAAVSASALMHSRRYVDDMRYTRSWMMMHGSGKSRQQMSLKMRQSGVDEAVIEQVLEENGADDMKTLRSLYRKKYAGRLDVRDPAAVRKAVGFFMRRGFHYDDIAAVIREEEEESTGLP